MEIIASPGLNIGDWYSLSGFRRVGFDERTPVEYPQVLLYTGQSIYPQGYDVFLSRFDENAAHWLKQGHDNGGCLTRVKIPATKFYVRERQVKTDQLVEERSIFRPWNDHEEDTVRYLKRCEKLLDSLPVSLEREMLLIQVKDSLYKEWSHTVHFDDGTSATFGKIDPVLIRTAFGMSLDDKLM